MVGRSAAAAVLVLALAGLGACSASPGTGSPTSGTVAPTLRTPDPVADKAALDAVTVTGTGADTAPTVSGTPVAVGGTTLRVLTEGSGPVATDKDTAGVRIVIVNGTSGKVLDSTYQAVTKEVRLRLGDPTLLKGLATAIKGQKQGSVVLAAIAPADAFGPQGNAQIGLAGTDTLLAVVDVRTLSRPVTVSGPMTQAGAGLPTVAMNGAVPTITMPKATPPTDLVVKDLITGTGAVTKAGQVIDAYYTLARWRDGKQLETSFGKSPIQFPVGMASLGKTPGGIAAWDKGLVGQKIGSRVLLVVPPKDGYGSQGQGADISGTDTLVFVVDIVDAG